MKFFTQNNILHIIYSKKDISTNKFLDIQYIAKLYENIDSVKTFIGFNFPSSFIPNDSFLSSYKHQVDYVIVYKDGDKKTKHHELCHANFFLYDDYKNKVYELWNSLSKKSKYNITQMLLRMNYNNNQETIIDEFQAYYYTEKPNFFGKLL